MERFKTIENFFEGENFEEKKLPLKISNQEEKLYLNEPGDPLMTNGTYFEMKPVETYNRQADFE